MKDSIKGWNFVAKLEGLKEFREDKLKTILDD